MLLQVISLDTDAVDMRPLEVVKAVAMVAAEAGFGQSTVDEGTGENPPLNYILVQELARQEEHRGCQCVNTLMRLSLLIKGSSNISGGSVTNARRRCSAGNGIGVAARGTA